MANMDLLLRSISFIEDHLDENMQTEDIAAACYASKSNLEKVFKFTTKFSVHDYITRRRMNKAARMMLEKPELSLLDIAVQYGYSSHEAFTRAFAQVWKCTPSDYRTREGKKIRPFELFPQFTGVMQIEGEPYMRRTLDISELYDFFKARKDCYFVCCDIVSMEGINAVSREAGDIAILTAMKRMEECGGDEDVVFRIGSDEFVMLTNSADKNYAEEVCAKIRARNGELIDYKTADVPLKLYATSVKVELENLRYNELFNQLQISWEEKKRQAGK